jgi:hypothetical protein
LDDRVKWRRNKREVQAMGSKGRHNVKKPKKAQLAKKQAQPEKKK